MRIDSMCRQCSEIIHMDGTGDFLETYIWSVTRAAISYKHGSTVVHILTLLVQD